jgi:hypothetical protein
LEPGGFPGVENALPRSDIGPREETWMARRQQIG